MKIEQEERNDKKLNREALGRQSSAVVRPTREPEYDDEVSERSEPAPKRNNGSSAQNNKSKTNN